MPDNSDTASKLFVVLLKCAHTLSEHASRNMEALGLCPSDFMVLEALFHKGPLSISAIGSKVLLTSGSMTAAVDRLQKRGLVERREVAEDRRVRLVQLTAAGKRLMTAAFPKHAEALATAAQGLTVREQEQLLSLARKLGLSAEKMLAEKPA